MTRKDWHDMATYLVPTSTGAGLHLATGGSGLGTVGVVVIAFAATAVAHLTFSLLLDE